MNVAGLRRRASGALRRAARLIDRPSHQVAAHQTLSRYMDFIGKDILEIGGSQSCESMIPFMQAGAASGVVTGLDHISEEKRRNESNIQVRRADALALVDSVGEANFDVIYGLSIVEHIPDPGRFLEQVHRVLRPGGMAYFEGNPIWSSARGHHLWIATWGGAYQGRTSSNYLFSPYPGYPSTNPLPDWSHLLMSRTQMQAYLEKQALPANDITCILDWVYSSSEINRLSLPEIAAAYSRSPLIVLEANTARQDVPPDVESALRSAYDERTDFGVTSIIYVLSKP